jgi:hypothetical protein
MEHAVQRFYCIRLFLCQKTLFAGRLFDPNFRVGSLVLKIYVETYLAEACYKGLLRCAGILQHVK